MAGCNKPKSPCGSSTDSLIEKIRMEITKKSDEDLLNIKKLSIQASNKSRDSTPQNSCDIDKKISDLECLIKKLQEELNEMYCASKRAEDECDICPPPPPICCGMECARDEPECPGNTEDKCQSEEEMIIDKINSMLEQTEQSVESASERYPIILRDIDHVQEQDDKYACDETELNEEPTILTNENVADEKFFKHGLKQNVANIGQRVSYDWDRDKNDSKEEITPTDSEDNVTVMIAELRAEIDDTLHTLSQKTYGPGNLTPKP